MSSWLILAILSGFASNTYNFLNRFLLKDSDDPTIYAWFTELIRFILFACIAVSNWKLVITPESFIILLFVGLTEFAGGYFYMKMHAYTHLSISTILSRTRLIWVPIFGFIIIHELLTIANYLGIVVIFLGVSVIMSPKKLFIDKGAIYANIAAVIIALNVVLLQIALPYASNSVLNAVMSVPSLFLYPLVMKNTAKRIKTFTKSNLLLKVVAGSISVAQLMLFVAALSVGDASKVNAIYQGMLIFSVLAGIFILKEKQGLQKKIIGTIITVIGVVILSLT